MLARPPRSDHRIAATARRRSPGRAPALASTPPAPGSPAAAWGWTASRSGRTPTAASRTPQ